MQHFNSNSHTKQKKTFSEIKLSENVTPNNKTKNKTSKTFCFKTTPKKLCERKIMYSFI